jgi:hypothetical protein
MSTQVKECSKCKTVYPLSNIYFRKRPDSVDGLRNECKSCTIKMEKERKDLDIKNMVRLLKTKEDVIVKSKYDIQIWNDLKRYFLTKDNSFSFQEIVHNASKQRLSYYCVVITHLIKAGVIIKRYDNQSGLVNYSFKDKEPIHYNVIVESIMTAKAEAKAKAKAKAKNQNLIEKPAPEPAQAQEKINFLNAEKPVTLTLQGFSDSVLVNELRQRGYTVVASKTIEL